MIYLYVGTLMKNGKLKDIHIKIIIKLKKTSLKNIK